MRNFLKGITFGLLLIPVLVFADSGFCDSNSNKYCININISEEQKTSGSNLDLCYVVQLNGNDVYAAGSIPIEQLPTVLFSTSDKFASFGKPLSFKIIKAQLVQKGQCKASYAKHAAVKDCNIMEFSTIGGTSRVMTLNKTASDSFFTCKIK